MFFGKKKDKPKSKSKPADTVGAVAATSPALTSGRIEIGDLTTYSDVIDGSSRGGRGGALVLEPRQTWMTASRLPARPGERFSVQTTANLLKRSTNGHDSSFFVGPIFFNQANEVVGWWSSVAPPATAGESQKVSIRSVAPANSVSVGIGLCGAWSGDPDAIPNSTVEFRGARLVKD